MTTLNGFHTLAAYDRAGAAAPFVYGPPDQLLRLEQARRRFAAWAKGRVRDTKPGLRMFDVAENDIRRHLAGQI